MSVLRVERDDKQIVTLTLNRPEAGNSFNRELLGALGDAVANLAADASVRAVIVTGAGDKVFCAGADLKERATMTEPDVLATVTLIRATIDAVARLPMPTIAAINGHALGGGLELALACDIRVLAPGAQVGLPETTLAIIPGGGGTARLVRLLGTGRAKELILTGRRVGAKEAESIALVESIGDLDAAREIATKIAVNGPLAVRAAKRVLSESHELPLAQALELETRAYETLIATQDRVEGLRAFKEKRAPDYKGE